jgi:hypothetical protein
MCGIAGFGSSDGAADAAVAERMAGRIETRTGRCGHLDGRSTGPDGAEQCHGRGD